MLDQLGHVHVDIMNDDHPVCLRIVPAHTSSELYHQLARRRALANAT